MISVSHLNDCFKSILKFLDHKMMPPETASNRDHYLSVKMHRLSKPSFVQCHPIKSDLRDSPGMALEDIRDITECEKPLATSQMMLLPTELGSVYLGETYSFYVTVTNDSHQKVKDVSVKIDLQTTSTTHLLNSGNPPLESLEADTSIDIVLNHEIKDIGAHNIVVHVSYVTLTGEKNKFKKNQKFQVAKPLDVKTTFFNPLTNDIYLQAQIQNITSVPMVMESVLFEPSSQYKVTDMNNASYSFDGVSYMNPRDMRQYIYKLTPENPNAIHRSVEGQVAGKLDITWRTQMGERGRLQTSNLLRRVLNPGEIRVTVEKLPHVIQSEIPFPITLNIINCSDRLLQLQVHFQNLEANPLRWLGVSGRSLGSLDSKTGASIKFDAMMVASYPGSHILSGFKLFDSFLRKTYDFNNITTVYVTSQ